MSYILYINGSRIELSERAQIAQTKQVNDLARLDNRQSNFTNKFIAPPTANNIRAMEKVYLVGNQSNIPYQKNECNLFDSESNECLIYKGWAVVSQTSNKGYEINVYDGIIDFYRKIENKTLTDMGISALNHAKNLTTIINSWTGNLPYYYAFADYNGNNIFTNSNNQTFEINTDFQVPSARVSFLWQRIHAFAGHTYSGSYFDTADFMNWFMSFPKPIPTLSPIVDPISTQTSTMSTRTVQQFDLSFVIYFDVHFFPAQITTARLNINSIGFVTFTQSGAYRLKSNGSFGISFNGSPPSQNGMIGWTLSGPGAPTALNTTSGQIDASKEESVIINVNVGQFLFLSAPIFAQTGDVITSIDYVVGYDANFEEALVDFSAKDFANEVMQSAGLTGFKDKYSNHIEYLTMDEILESPTPEDWSDKFQIKDSEKYKIGKYAKRNNFKYRYNTDNETHNDGFITINDQNLNDQVDIINSKIYSPERDKSFLASQSVNVFKIWDRELKENQTIEYKDLAGRYYFMRSKNVNGNFKIASKLLNTNQDVSLIGFADFARLSFGEILFNNYASISSILDKAKVIEAFFFLKTIDIERFTFKNLIYVKQLGSYYLVNKINAFVKGKLTKCELIEVDYKKETLIVGPPINTATYITIDSFVVNGCVVTITYSTDASIGTNIDLICEVNNFGLPPTLQPNPLFGFNSVVQNTGVINTTTFNLQAGTFYQLTLRTQIATTLIVSNTVFFENTAGCIATNPPPIPTLTTLTITSIQTLSVVNGQRNVRVNYTSNFSGTDMLIECFAAFFTNLGVSKGQFIKPPNGYLDIIIGHFDLDNVTPATWTIAITALGITSNSVTS